MKCRVAKAESGSLTEFGNNGFVPSGKTGVVWRQLTSKDRYAAADDPQKRTRLMFMGKGSVRSGVPNRGYSYPQGDARLNIKGYEDPWVTEQLIYLL